MVFFVMFTLIDACYNLLLSLPPHSNKGLVSRKPGTEIIKLFMLNSAEHKIYPAHICYNTNNCWHVNIY